MRTSYLPLLRKRLNQTIDYIPFWQVENHPEHLASIGVPPAIIDEYRANTTINLVSMLRWAVSNTPLVTSDAVFGEFETQRAMR